MTADLERRLAEATGDLDARTAMLDAAWATWGHGHGDASDKYHAACVLLDGPPAGWIGVGVLMHDADDVWMVEACVTFDNEKTGNWQAANFKGNVMTRRPDTALCLAALLSRRAGGGDNGQG